MNWINVAKKIVPNEFKEFYSNRRPDSVNFTDIGTDVKRRDLTINALFYDIDKDQVVDLVGGIDDLKSGNIRTVGSPTERFEEDPLRKLRALRFYAKLGKKIDSETLEALKDTNLDGVSVERIRDEFIKSIQSAKSTKKYLILADKLGYLSQILGGVGYSTDFIDENDVEIQLGLLLRKENIPDVKDMLKRMRYTNDEVRNIVTMIEIFQIADTNQFDKIYSLKRLYEISDKLKIRSFGRKLNLTQFIEALSKTDPRSVNIPALAKQFSKDDLGDAIKKAVETQFINLYHGKV